MKRARAATMLVSLPRCLLLLFGLVLVAAPCSAASKQTKAVVHPAHLRDADLLRSLASAPLLSAFRLQGEWAAGCDSILPASKSPLDCFDSSATVQVRSREAVSRLLDVLAPCAWIPSKGWISPAAPTLGVRFRGDSVDVALLLSIRALKATISIPGEGSIGTAIPESSYSHVAVCLWRIDPGNPETSAAIRAELLSRGLDPKTEPPPDDWDGEPINAAVSEDGMLIGFDEPPAPVSQVQPVYPKSAWESGVQGRVVLHVLIGRDGRVKRIRVSRSIPDLDSAARDAVRQWIFKPALLLGAPVAAWIEVPVEFHP